MKNKPEDADFSKKFYKNIEHTERKINRFIWQSHDIIEIKKDNETTDGEGLKRVIFDSDVQFEKILSTITEVQKTHKEQKPTNYPNKSIDKTMDGDDIDG